MNNSSKYDKGNIQHISKKVSKNLYSNLYEEIENFEDNPSNNLIFMCVAKFAVSVLYDRVNKSGSPEIEVRSHFMKCFHKTLTMYGINKKTNC